MHGTGTPVGDPLEVEAVSRVFAELKTPEDPLLIGSVSLRQFSTLRVHHANYIPRSRPILATVSLLVGLPGS